MAALARARHLPVTGLLTQCGSQYVLHPIRLRDLLRELWILASKSIYSNTPMIYDVAAVEYLYGDITDANTGNTTYTFGDTDHQRIKTIVTRVERIPSTCQTPAPEHRRPDPGITLDVSATPPRRSKRPTGPLRVIHYRQCNPLFPQPNCSRVMTTSGLRLALP